MSDRKRSAVRERREYSDRDKADALAVLASNAGNVKRTARETGIPERTLASWRDRPASGKERAVTHVRSQLLADKMERLIWKLARAVPDKIDGAQLPAIVNGIGTLFDRMTLLRATNARESETTAAGLDLSRLSTDQLRTFLDLVEIAGGDGSAFRPESEDGAGPAVDMVILTAVDLTGGQPSGGQQEGPGDQGPPDISGGAKLEHSV